MCIYVRVAGWVGWGWCVELPLPRIRTVRRSGEDKAATVITPAVSIPERRRVQREKTINCYPEGGARRVFFFVSREADGKQ